MITRFKHPTLTRSIASTPVLPPSVHKSVARTYDEVKDKSQHPASNSKDPWAPIFDDISNAAPPVPSPHPHLPVRFFTSRPAPKTFFSSNSPRSLPPSGSGRRDYVTDVSRARSSGHPASNNNKSLERGSAWDHVFEGIDSTLATPGASPQSYSLGTSNLMASPFPASGARRPTRRPTMTAREISAFDDMFDMIFAAASKTREPKVDTGGQLTEEPNEPRPSPSTSSPHTPATEPSTPVPSQSIGRSPSGEVFDLFGKLRRHSNRMRRTSATDELLDRQKEEMELCDTDQELLAWATRSIFPETPPASPDAGELARYLANPTYPHVLAHLMRTFRIKYRDPHTALALFAHAKRRSIHSYVFGCTTPAYNELIEIRWELNGQLAGVEAALAEMHANGVAVDKQTRLAVERVRREIGERMFQRHAEEGDEGEVWNVLERIEAFVQKKRARGSKPCTGKESSLDAKKRHWNEEWKSGGNTKLGEDRLSLGV